MNLFLTIGASKWLVLYTSLSKHIDELRVLLQNNSLGLLAINETRLNETIADNEVSISGYNIVRRDRSLNGRNGGGVCFYVRSNKIILCVRISYLINSKIFRLKSSSREVSPLLGPFTRGKIRRELDHLYEHVLSNKTRLS